MGQTENLKIIENCNLLFEDLSINNSDMTRSWEVPGSVLGSEETENCGMVAANLIVQKHVSVLQMTVLHKNL